jgi:GTP-binding protein
MIFDKSSTEFLMGIDSPEQLQKWLNEHPAIKGFAFIGRSNVGKSSLINAYFGQKTARVSKTPGRTRQVNIFSFSLCDDPEKRKYYLFDVPGYGYAEVSKEMGQNWQYLMNLFFNYISNQTVMINIQDARHPYLEADRSFFKYLKGFNLNTILVFNKMDKIKTQKEKHALKLKTPELFKIFKWVQQIHFVSAEKKDGLDSLEETMKIWLFKL